MEMITEKKLYNITLFYLTKYDSSTEKVRQMLRRRIHKIITQNKTEVPKETNQWIENIIHKMIDLGYLNDSRFAENQVRILSNQGKSNAFIINKLKQSGISAEKTKLFLREQNADELTRAIIWLKRHKKGAFRNNYQPNFYTKDLTALGRAGFSYEIAVQALQDAQKETGKELHMPQDDFFI